VAISLAFAGYGVWALITASVTSAVAQTLITFALARFSVVPAITSHMRDLLKMSLGMTVFGGLAMLSAHAAKFVIGRLLGADALGIFNRARRVLEFPRDMVGSAQVLFPVMSDMSHDRARMARGYLRSVALCTLAGVPLTVLVCHGADGLILLLLGPRWVAAVEPTSILALALPFAMVIQVTMAVFMALAQVQALILRQFVFAVLVISTALIGSRWGLAGVCIGVVASTVVNYGVSIHLANRLLDVGWSRFGKASLPALILAVPVLAVLVLGEALVWRDAPTLIRFPIEAVATGAVIYGASFVKQAWFLGPDGIWLLAEARRRVPARLRGLLPKPAD
jgi:PST family polysaccharide transporter